MAIARSRLLATVLWTANVWCFSTLNAAGPTQTNAGRLWRDPGNIANRDLLYGSGGKNDLPAEGAFEFVKEDLAGTNPKLTVRDSAGVKWKVKLGAEARPETVATRIVWAVGYLTDEDYFLPSAQVLHEPRASHRLRGLISTDGRIVNTRFEREHKHLKKIGGWSWRRNPFAGSRELNGLRVLMALLNNWDLKDENNSIYRAKDGSEIFVVSDLGATFGTTGYRRGNERSRGNLDSFEHSKFLTHRTAERVDFATPSAPTPLMSINPFRYVLRLHLRGIGRNIPREDARWIGGLLARLSPQQIRDAFRAGGYSPEEVERFATILERRIAELNAL